ncbi:hypothetical protein [Streptomyces sp. NPDC058247]|uniref:hypothetical protein n=1 Tax=Streptomyces sp. NPDC058247 TaxID=3346401 RepID=UPI0036E71339
MFCPIATVITTTACLTALAPGTVSAQQPVTAPFSVTAPGEVGRTDDLVGRTGSLSRSDSGDGNRDQGSGNGNRDQGSGNGNRDQGNGNRDQGSGNGNRNEGSYNGNRDQGNGNRDQGSYNGNRNEGSYNGNRDQGSYYGTSDGGSNYRGARAGVGSTAGGGVDLGRIGFGAALAGGAGYLLWRRTRAPHEG